MASESETEKRETLADIVADMRNAGALMPVAYMRDLLNYAERIEAIDSADAWRSLYAPPVGNAAAMREALLKLRAEIERFYNNEWIPYDAWQGCDDVISHAIAAPPRNCDVGTAKEQEERFREFCQAEKCGRYRCRGGSKSICIDRCAIAWAQMPYEAEREGEGDGAR